MQLRWRFAKNAMANLGRGGATAVFALLLPPILVRHMDPASYAVWVLVLQTAAYVGYLDFGMQTAIGRYVAFANEKGDAEQRDSIFSTAVAGLCAAAVLSLTCLGVVIVVVPAIFPAVPQALLSGMRWSLLIVGFSMAVTLPASACNGAFVGMQRYEIPAISTGVARLIAAAGLVFAAFAGNSLVVMAAIVASTNLLSYLAQYIALRRVAPDIRFHTSLIRRSTARELSSYCFGLTVVSFSMLLVTGLDLVLVGRFEFSAVTPYSIAAGMIALLSGLLYAVINVILPHGAALHARERAADLGELVISTTRISVLLLVLTGIPILLYAGPIIRVWIGDAYVAKGTVLLSVLIVANIIRLVCGPYSLVLVATGQQRYITVSPLAEGTTNFAASIILGLRYGAQGVAYGTLLGAVVGIASHFLYSMPRTRQAISFSRQRFLLSGILTPLLWTSPLLLAGLASWQGLAVPVPAFVLAAILSAAVAALLLFRAQKTVQA